MKLIIVPGNSGVHKEWADKAKEEFGPLFEDTQILYYSHWGTEQEILDFDLELEKLVGITQDLTQYVIFAKSAGTLLVMKGVLEGKLHPVKCLFVGIPFSWATWKEIPFETWVKNFPTPVRIIQQEYDSTCTAEELEKSLKAYGVEHYTLKVIQGENHDYSDWEDLKNELTLFTE
jgi:hypothetical protein